MSSSEKDRLLGSDDNEEEEELTGCGGTLACNPRRFLHRYLVLIIMCFLSFGKYRLVTQQSADFCLFYEHTLPSLRFS